MLAVPVATAAYSNARSVYQALLKLLTEESFGCPTVRNFVLPFLRMDQPAGKTPTHPLLHICELIIHKLPKLFRLTYRPRCCRRRGSLSEGCVAALLLQPRQPLLGHGPVPDRSAAV